MTSTLLKAIDSFHQQVVALSADVPLSGDELNAVLNLVRTWTAWSMCSDDALRYTAWEGPVDYLVGVARPELCDAAWWTATTMSGEVMACL